MIKAPFLEPKKTSTGVFVPARFGFREVTDYNPGGSINDVITYLGYHSDQIYVHYGDFDQNKDVYIVGLEILSSNIVFVMAKTSVVKLKKSKVDYFLKDFSVKNFKGPDVEGFLMTGVKNRSLDITFLSRVLQIKAPALNGIFHVNSIGLNLIFEQGYLTGFSPSDGLNQWGKLWNQLNPKLVKDYEDQAIKYWGNSPTDVIREINAQAEAFANTPGGLNSEFKTLHKTEYGLIDFCSLMVCHHEQAITHSEFITLNHGRYELAEEINKLKIYKMRNFTYKFWEDEKLLIVTKCG